MLLNEARKIIEGKPKGFRVHFEHAGDGFLRGDYFPDRDEKPFETEEEAWTMAHNFAVKTKGKCVNIYVTCDNRPVDGYKDKEIINR